MAPMMIDIIYYSDVEDQSRNPSVQLDFAELHRRVSKNMAPIPKVTIVDLRRISRPRR